MYMNVVILAFTDRPPHKQPLSEQTGESPSFPLAKGARNCAILFVALVLEGCHMDSARNLTLGACDETAFGAGAKGNKVSVHAPFASYILACQHVDSGYRALSGCKPELHWCEIYGWPG